MSPSDRLATPEELPPLVRAVKVGVTQSGIRLNASCSPFDVVPPELYARFKQAVIEYAKTWGLRVHFGQDDGTISQAEGRYWEMQRAHVGPPAKE